MDAFLRDLCTPEENRAMVKRWQVCQELAKGGGSYRLIQEETGCSPTTIGRVARFLQEGDGYRRVLRREKENEK